MSLTHDDIRAAVAAGTITEAQAVSVIAQSDARRGTRKNLQGHDEPFELFKGFNEIFIVVGLSILYAGWIGMTGISLMFSAKVDLSGTIFGFVGMIAAAALARYFTLTRRMVAPSIALTIMFSLSSIQLGWSFSNFILKENPMIWTLTSGISTVCLLAYWLIYRVPFTLLLIAISVFATTFFATLVGGATLSDAGQMFVLSGTGPFSLLTILLGFIGLALALRFDMSDPHRVTRRAQNGFWLHIIAAPAIVNTIAITLFQSDSDIALLGLILFLTAMSLFAIIIDRRSFLIAAISYVVAIAVTVIEGDAALTILILGGGLVLLGAKWEAIRCTLMNRLPDFPGKNRLPPYAKDPI